MMKLPVLAMMLLWMAPAKGDEALVLELKYTKPAEMERTLKIAARQFDKDMEITTEGNRITLRGADEDLRKQLAKLVAEIDSPPVHIPTRFIKLSHASAEKAAEFLNKVLNNQLAAEGAKPDQAEEVPIQVVPATRTNEVFVMGRAEDIKLIESILRAIDTDPQPIFK